MGSNTIHRSSQHLDTAIFCGEAVGQEMEKSVVWPGWCHIMKGVMFCQKVTRSQVKDVPLCMTLFLVCCFVFVMSRIQCKCPSCLCLVPKLPVLHCDKVGQSFFPELAFYYVNSSIKQSGLVSLVSQGNWVKYLLFLLCLYFIPLSIRVEGAGWRTTWVAYIIMLY